ncbi:uncharacterized protein LOC110263182 [Arachis ipaensis]|uniref:uncharacterized protein LOC110263181 n=1 Tax=Arachis ipaensis TaxID=130454 RepID=UPI000A2AF2E9|nr:uncharacterized protein LOC110263181 [Arachis ipaensis]XP_020959743.1 uncharacterized protein LOC110263182 [Arachis ipaensis]XP_029149356.1 uncharacterized protein LOC114925442 [Arachis hypogaea]QHN85263.1 uncharacterized protein DS421_16g535850 [Arachis hypogaea]
MRSFLEKKKEGKEVSVNKVVKESNVDAAQFTTHPRGEKRKSHEPEGSVEVLFGVNLVFSSRVRSGVKKQMCLHGFVSGSSAESVWSDQFPFAALAYRVTQNTQDVQLLRTIGKEIIGQYMQVMATRLLCVGRCTEMLGV